MTTGKELTIYDIAQRAGVSPATVSRVLNRHGGVNRKTLDRVNAVLAETGFKPRWQAGGVKMIGVLLPPYPGALLDPYDSYILSCCRDELLEQGYSLQLLCPEQVQMTSAGSCPLAATNLLSGIMVISTPPNYEICHYLLSKKNHLPAVVIGNLNTDTVMQTSSGRHIGPDHYTAGYQAAMLLLRHNHRRFHLVTASLDDIAHRHRYEGILAALKSYDIPEADIVTTEVREWLRKNGERLAAELACKTERPDALIFTQSSICAGFIHGCMAMNLKVPDDFSVVAFEDNGELEHLIPPITVMTSPSPQIAREAVKSLLAQIEECPVPPPDLIAHSPIFRQSVKSR